MPSVAITPSLVLASVLTFRRGLAGTAPITAGQVLYLNTSDRKIYKATAISSAPAASAGAIGFALNTAHTVGAPLEYVSEDDAFAIGGAVTAGTQYYLSITAGEVCQYSDLPSGSHVVPLFTGKTGNLAAIKINISAATVP